MFKYLFGVEYVTRSNKKLVVFKNWFKKGYTVKVKIWNFLYQEYEFFDVNQFSSLELVDDYLKRN